MLSHQPATMRDSRAFPVRCRAPHRHHHLPGVLRLPHQDSARSESLDGVCGGNERAAGEGKVRNGEDFFFFFFVPQLPLFSPQSPGQRAPAGTHLIIHPVRVPRSKWHSDKFCLTTCKVLGRFFFLICSGEKCLHCSFFLCVLSSIWIFKLQASQPELAAAGQTSYANGPSKVIELTFQ